MISRSAQIVSRTLSLTISTPRAIAFNDDARRERLRQQIEISALPGRLHISHRGARAPAVGDVGVDPAKALGDIRVEIVDDREARALSGGEERIADRQVNSRRLDRYRPVIPMPFTGAAGVTFGFLEVGQHVIERPSMAAALRPLIVFERVAAQIEHAVDAARTAEDAPLEPPQFAAIQCRNRLGLEVPIASWRGAGDEPGAWDLGREPEPGAAGLNQGDANIRHCLRQAAGDDTARRTRADNDIIPAMLLG